MFLIVIFYNKKYDKRSLLNIPMAFYELNGPLFFGSINSFTEIINNHESFKKIEILIIDISKVSMFDLSGIIGIEDFIINLKRLNKNIYVLNTTSSTDKYLKKLNFVKNIGNKNYFKNEDFINNIIQEDFKLKLKK